MIVEALGIVTNAIRLWGGIAGIICIADVFGNRERFTHPSVTLLLAIFLIIAGTTIPLVILIPMSQNALTYALLLLVSWICIASAGWLKVCAGRKPIMKITAGLSLVATILAAYVIG